RVRWRLATTLRHAGRRNVQLLGTTPGRFCGLRKRANTAQARQALKEAFGHNPHVVVLVLKPGRRSTGPWFG
ncbi:MAG TPA: hypothetical protein VIL95_00910, partial [Bacillota bacterium]